MADPKQNIITIDMMAKFVDELVLRVSSAPYHRGLEQYFVLGESDFQHLRALQRYLNDYAVPYANDFRRIVVQKSRAAS